MSLIEETLKNHGYICQESIGKGGFGSCFLITSTKYNQEFACKVINPTNSSNCENVSSFHREVSALIALDHPSIIHIYDVFEENNMTFIILEYCSGGNLKDKIDLLHGIKGQLLFDYIIQIVNALKYVHTKGYAHNDIKPSNVFITSYGKLKLADFGLTEHNVLDTCRYCGSFDYMAPEVIKRLPHDPIKSDIWSLGVTIYQIASGELPFGATNGSELLHEIKMGYEKIKWLPPALSYIIKICLQTDPNKRPTIDEIDEFLHKALITERKSQEYPIPTKRMSNPSLGTMKRLIIIPKVLSYGDGKASPF